MKQFCLHAVHKLECAFQCEMQLRDKKHKKLKEHFSIGQNMQIFKKVLFLKLHTTEKQKNKQIIQLSLCHLDGQRVVEGKGHETDSK